MNELNQSILREWESQLNDLEEKTNLIIKSQRGWLNYFKEKSNSQQNKNDKQNESLVNLANSGSTGSADPQIQGCGKEVKYKLDGKVITTICKRYGSNNKIFCPKCQALEDCKNKENKK